MLDYKRAEEMVRELTGDDGVLDYKPEQARLLVQVLRTLARGRPVSAQEIDVIAADFGWAPEAASHGFLRPLTERDAADAVIGVVPGLSLGNHPHRLSVNGRQMSAWCGGPPGETISRYSHRTRAMSSDASSRAGSSTS